MPSWKDQAKQVTDTGSWKSKAITVSDMPTYESGVFDFDRLEAVGKGALKGATFDYGDEIIAGIKAGLKSVKDPMKLKQNYEIEVKKERDELKRLEEKYPIEFIGAELGGAVASSLAIPIPGTTAARGSGLIAKGSRLLPEAFLQATGAAEAPIGSKSFLKETAMGTAGGVALGSALGGIGKATGKLLEQGKQPIKRATQFISDVIFDLPFNYTNKLMDSKTAQKILDPKSSKDIVNGIHDLTKKMGEQAKALSIKAGLLLSPEKNIPIGTETAGLIGDLNSLPLVQSILISELSGAKAAKSELKNVAETLTGMSDGVNVSERDLKDFLKMLDNSIGWDKNTWTEKEKMLAEIRTYIDHSLLKQNKAYEEAMIPVAELTRTLKDLGKSFSFVREGKYNLKPTDATYSKINQFFDAKGVPKKPVTEEALVKAQKYFPEENLIKDIETAQIAKRTEGGVTQGSRSTIYGATVGGAYTWAGGDPMMIAILGTLGFIKDKFGRRAGKSILPKVTPAIEQSDEALRELLQGVDPDRLAKILGTIGRQRGVELGTEAQQYESPLLPRSK